MSRKSVMVDFELLKKAQDDFIRNNGDDGNTKTDVKWNGVDNLIVVQNLHKKSHYRILLGNEIELLKVSNI